MLFLTYSIVGQGPVDASGEQQLYVETVHQYYVK